MKMDEKKYRRLMRKWATQRATRREILDCLAYQRHREAVAEAVARGQYLERSA